jgi:multidrug resistance protein, MATE family
MNLAVDPVRGRRILTLAAPAVLAMLSQTLINQVDDALVGRLDIREATPGQAAIGMSLILMWSVGGFLSAISVGTQALTARRIGEKKLFAAGQVMLNSVTLAAIASAIASVAAWWAVPKLFPLINRDPNVLRLGVPYLRWRMLGVMSMVTTIAYKSWFDGLGDTYVHMVAAITMNVINFFLNVALIFGKWGFPAMGVEGSGLASMISSYIGLALIIAWSFLPRYHRDYQSYHLKNLSGKQQWEIAKLSLPSGGATLFVMSGFGLFSKIVGVLDGEAALLEPGRLPIYTNATQQIIFILMVFFTGCLAYGTATATLVGQEMGARRTDIAEKYGWEAVKLGMLITAVIGILIVTFPESVLRIFCHDPQVIDVARPILRVCGFMLPFVLSGLVLTQALFGAGNTTFVMAVEFTLHFFCLVPLAYICGVKMGWGVYGVWSGAFAYVLLLASIMAAKFAGGGWKEIRI